MKDSVLNTALMNKEVNPVAELSSRILMKFKHALIIDFEAVPNGNIFHVGAVFNHNTFEKKDIKDSKAALKELSAFSSGADYILGHNIINHDLALVKETLPDAPILQLPVIDTLYLSPLAFPENPYHKLIKNYKLIKNSKNNPVADANLTWAVFEDQVAAFSVLNQTDPGLISFYAFAFEPVYSKEQGMTMTGIFDLFYSLSQSVPNTDKAKQIFMTVSQGKICSTAFESIWDDYCGHLQKRPVLAYALSWLRVSGGNSIIPAWVKHEFPQISTIINRLRYACGSKDCEYCRENNGSEKLLKKYFGFDEYRMLPDGRKLQKEIIESNLKGNSLLGILPTGGGKSICYQIPALHRYHRTGDLTIVISPLKALMKDQVDNLNMTIGMETAGAINGSLTLPERGSVMEKVRLGDIGILYISPEQLRNYSVAELIGSRDVGCWVFDEAHCLSKWGHDFRPDYLNVSDFIVEHNRRSMRPPLIGAFTATAKKDVIQEVCSHFTEKLDLDLIPFISGVQRENLSFQVWPVTKNEKHDVVFNCLKESVSDGGGAIVYCASRKKTEEISAFLNEKGIASQAFHAGRSEPDKRNIQDDFVAGKIPVICATNAFGMGIDKKDIRLVVHADIPGSLENYLQEAGRAGRDTAPADCILLYEPEDIESQFSLNAYSKLTLKDIKKILGVLRKRGAKTPEIVITPGEIMRLIGYANFAEDDSRARIGISWLERKGFLKRSFNQTLFFKGKPLVRDMNEAEQKIAALNLSKMMAMVFRTILFTLFNADKDSILSADVICADLGKIENLPEEYLDSRFVIGLLSQMAEVGLIKEGVLMTAFVKPKGQGNSLKLLESFLEIETQMLALMEELSPDAGISPDTPDVIHLRLMSQRLKDKGFDQVNTDAVGKILQALANDKGESQGKSLKIAGRRGAEQQMIYVRFSWQKIKKRMILRHNCSRLCLNTIISSLPKSLRHGQAQVMSEFFLSQITKEMQSDVFLSGYRGDHKALIERSLLFMHDMKVITLQNGLAVFRQALNLTMLPESRKRQYTQGDYEPLSLHYAQKNVQVHVMEKYARLGLEKIKTALRFVSDYFSISYDSFIQQHFPREKTLIQTAMTAEAYKKIIQSLENHTQEAIVAALPEKNILVLAGPGSGKTKTIVHRCAWLIKAKSVDPSSILVLCFNHQAMVELRRRIRALTGRRANSVTAMTYHGFAMHLTGRSFMENQMGHKSGENAIGFDTIIDEAVEILNGEREIAGIEQSEAREHLLAQYRYILVDEYQDIDDRQYRFISALTGRLEQDQDMRISIMAVGDDDQSIYGFRNANVKFIKQFQQDYEAKIFYLMENYRSFYPIIQASNQFIALNENRMKTGYPCRINGKRRSHELAAHKIETNKLVQVVLVKNMASQAVFVARKIKQLMADNPDMELHDVAVVSRQGMEYPPLVSLRMALAKEEIPFCYSIKNSSGFPLFRIREIQVFLQYLEDHQKESRTPSDLKKAVLEKFKQTNTWTTQIGQILESWCAINSDMEISIAQAKDFAFETLFEEKREHKTGTGVFLGTAHSVKGMEFPFVFILDGGWKQKNIEEERRLYYVAMTRSIKAVYACRIQGSQNPHVRFLEQSDFTHVSTTEESSINGFNEELTVSILGLEDLFLSYAGLFSQDHEIHKALSALKPLERISLIEKNNQIFIENMHHQSIARLSNKGKAKWHNQTQTILQARVLGIIRREKTDGKEFDGKHEKVESWELPIVEILHRKRV
ncbi:MAG: RecQ family ATP-dependent DNA helicase [Pseudomonadota bacterium]